MTTNDELKQEHQERDGGAKLEVEALVYLLGLRSTISQSRPLFQLDQEPLELMQAGVGQAKGPLQAKPVQICQ